MEWRLIGMSFVGVIGLAYKFVWFLMSNGWWCGARHESSCVRLCIPVEWCKDCGREFFEEVFWVINLSFMGFWSNFEIFFLSCMIF